MQRFEVLVRQNFFAGGELSGRNRNSHLGGFAIHTARPGDPLSPCAEKFRQDIGPNRRIQIAE
jgi:hypothetical protein